MESSDINKNQIPSLEEEVSKDTEISFQEDKDRLVPELQEMNDKYLRLYAEFENYKKRVNRDKEELIKYGNENLIINLLPVLDNLEMALKHATDDLSSGLVQGVEITLKEMKRTLEKFGLTVIEAEGKPFDPSIHHAMTQVEREDLNENTVVEEFRKGYMLKDKVLRPSLVAVSKKPSVNQQTQEKEIEINKIVEEES
ncbi:MAG: nucleotide exchange factor GrpE [Nitrospirae bacterium]|nr:nucleotide exchange factor GrpE [Nitrospirota bacterium]